MTRLYDVGMSRRLCNVIEVITRDLSTTKMPSQMTLIHIDWTKSREAILKIYLILFIFLSSMKTHKHKCMCKNITFYVFPYP